MAVRKKVYTTAVVLSPPKETWEPIQAIRERHDKSFNRWMPHINLLFPFVTEGDFEDSAQLAAEALKQIEPFEVTFDSFQYFQHANSTTLYLHPTPEDKVKKVQSILVQTFPFCDDQSNKSDAGFSPHLSVGQWSAREIERAKQNFTTSTLPKVSSFTASSIDIISREGDTPFVVCYTVFFWNGTNCITQSCNKTERQ